MTRKFPLTILAIFLSSNAQAGDIDTLAALLEGTFDTQAGNPEQPAEERLIDHRIRVNAPQFGDVVFYQQIRQKQDLEVYRQRLLVMTAIDDGSIEQYAWSFIDATRFVDPSSEDFVSLTKDDIDPTLPNGCEMIFTSTDDGFHGVVDPATCIITSSRTGKKRGIGAEAIVTNYGLKLAERGFDPETGELLFGTAPGEYYELKRTTL